MYEVSSPAAHEDIAIPWPGEFQMDCCVSPGLRAVGRRQYRRAILRFVRKWAHCMRRASCRAFPAAGNLMRAFFRSPISRATPRANWYA